MNAQEIFDTAGIAVLNQGKRSVNNDGSCVYRSKDGSRCAAGHLISDEIYSPSMEGRSIEGLLDTGDYVLPSFFNKYTSLLADMQLAHDNCDDIIISFGIAGMHSLSWSFATEMENFTKSMQAVAKKHGLDTTKFMEVANKFHFGKE